MPSSGRGRCFFSRPFPFDEASLTFPSESTRRTCDHGHLGVAWRDQEKKMGSLGEYRASGRREYHLRALRAFLRPLVFEEVAVPTIAKSSRLFPPFIAAVSQRGLRP